jgi:uncharacterized membrane protein
VSLAAFEATMTPAQRHLAHRLESFGDVVFGFTISQLALQFQLPVRPEDLVAHGFNYVVYALTFAIIALLWLSYHRMLSIAYVPTTVDIALTFVFLAFTGLAPYAMYAYLHFIHSLDGARYGLAAYLICGIGTTATSTLVRARNYARGSGCFTPAERLQAYRRLLVTSVIVLVFAAILAIDIERGVNAAVGWFFVLPVATVAIRRLVRSAPIVGAVPPVTAAMD